MKKKTTSPFWNKIERMRRHLKDLRNIPSARTEADNLEKEIQEVIASRSRAFRNRKYSLEHVWRG